MKNQIIILLLCTALFSCSSKKTNAKEEIVFTGQEFDMELLKGKWLTNGKRNKNQYSIFHENFTVEYADKRVFPFKLKKDSIFINGSQGTFFGRLIELNREKVFIKWGNQEAITYYRAKS